MQLTRKLFACPRGKRWTNHDECQTAVQPEPAVQKGDELRIRNRVPGVAGGLATVGDGTFKTAPRSLFHILHRIRFLSRDELAEQIPTGAAEPAWNLVAENEQENRQEDQNQDQRKR